MSLDDDEVTYIVGIFDSIDFNRFENVKYPFLMVTTEIQVVHKQGRYLFTRQEGCTDN